MSGQIGNPKGRPPDPPPAQSLTEGLWALASRPLTPADCARAALHLVDWLGCAVAGAATPTGSAVQQVAGGHSFALTGAAGALAMGGLAACWKWMMSTAPPCCIPGR